MFVFKKDRYFARSLFHKDEFYEIYVNTPLKVCIKRDPKKLYQRQLRGLTLLTGGYEKPESPSIKIDTSKENINHSVKKIINIIL